MKSKRLIEARAYYSDFRCKLGRRFREEILGVPTPKPVLVLTTSRSGSTWFCSLITNALKCGRIPEHIRPEHTALAMSRPDSHVITERVIKICADIKFKLVGGSKLIWDDFPSMTGFSSQFEQATLLRPLLELDPVIIRLKRKNRLSQAISREIASKTGKFHSRRNKLFPNFKKSADDSMQARLEFDEKSINHHMEILAVAEKNLDAFIAGSARPIIQLCYEELSNNPVNGLRQVVEAAVPELRPDRSLVSAKAAVRKSRYVATTSAINSDWEKKYLQKQKKFD